MFPKINVGDVPENEILSSMAAVSAVAINQSLSFTSSVFESTEYQDVKICF